MSHFILTSEKKKKKKKKENLSEINILCIKKIFLNKNLSKD